jgi:hypothetical protein
MKLYKGQSGPITDTKNYATALRLLSEQRNFCFPVYKQTSSEPQVRAAILKLTDEELVAYVQIAAQLSGADEAFAEHWFLKKLGL